MKELICGLGVGFAVGAFLARNYKPCGKMVDDVTDTVQSKMGAITKKGACECGEDCSCGN